MTSGLIGKENCTWQKAHKGDSKVQRLREEREGLVSVLLFGDLEGHRDSGKGQHQRRKMTGMGFKSWPGAW